MLIRSDESSKLHFTVSNLDNRSFLFRAVLGGKPFYAATLPQQNFYSNLKNNIEGSTLNSTKKTLIQNNIKKITNEVKY